MKPNNDDYFSHGDLIIKVSDDDVDDNDDDEYDDDGDGDYDTDGDDLKRGDDVTSTLR